MRKASTQLVPYLNSSNADAEKKMARPPVDPYRPADRKRRRAAQEPEDGLRLLGGQRPWMPTERQEGKLVSFDAPLDYRSCRAFEHCLSI